MRTLLAAAAVSLVAADRPNVLVVITDDQGFGDLAAHGNPILKTPRLDQFAGESAWLKQFWAYPVCSPARAGLLTGRHPYRAGVCDTYLGRSMLRPGVPTLAEQLAKAGYRTGLFGKWHLGDTFPLRPEDRGFQTTLWLAGGGLAQPADPPGTDPAAAYFDPPLTRDGKPVKTVGYCTDVFAEAAAGFVAAADERPFFAYVAFNAPHDPFQVPARFADPYRKRNLKPGDFPAVGQPWAGGKFDAGKAADAYGMIENLDGNVGRLLDTLDKTGRAKDTLVVFLTDNGPGGVRFNAGLRGRKGQTYEGGIRVPCYVRWPGRVPAGRVVDAPSAVIDLLPTLLAACGATSDPKYPPDGLNLLPALEGTGGPPADRTLFAQWHRGDAPEKGRAFAARGPRYKLVRNGTGPTELFDLTADPFEQKDLASELPAEVAKLTRAYEAWFADVTRDGFAPHRIVLGDARATTVRLTRQDWRGADGWGPTDAGHWETEVVRAGRYRFTLHARGPASGGLLRWRGGEATGLTAVAELSAGPHRFEAWVNTDARRRSADQVTVEFVGSP